MVPPANKITLKGQKQESIGHMPGPLLFVM